MKFEGKFPKSIFPHKQNGFVNDFATGYYKENDNPISELLKRA